MSTYYGTYGQKVQYLASDPTDVQVGQVWYNSTSATLKVQSVTTVGTFASGGNMNTARGYMGGVGTQTATLAFGGSSQPTIFASTESYNGTSWTSSPNNMNTARVNLGGTGTQTSALGFGGYAPGPGSTSATELYNGSSWTSNPTGLNTAREYLVGGAGTQTATLTAGGYRRSVDSNTNATETWNGSSWTTSPATLPTSIRQNLIIGTQTAALSIGRSPASATVFYFNGSSWTTAPSLNTARSNAGGAGTQTAAFVSGSIPAITTTEVYNGTSWTANPTGLSVTRYGLVGAGSLTSGMIFGGYAPPSTSTEEWTGPGAAVTKTVTVS
jgi:hypothetical protein